MKMSLRKYSCFISALAQSLQLGMVALSQREIAAGSAVAIAVLLHWRHDLHHFLRETLKEHEVRDGLILA